MADRRKKGLNKSAIINDRRKKDRRAITLIKKNFQNKFLKIIVSSLVAFMILSMAIFYIILRVKINQAGFSGYTEERLGEVLVWLNWALLILTGILTVLAGLWGKHLSFRVAGPLYALEKQLILLIEDKISKVQVRDKDNEMVPLANLINEFIEKKAKSSEE